MQLIDYELAESVFAKAKVSNVCSVNLWLGADVMVEYSLEEAKVGRMHTCLVSEEHHPSILQEQPRGSLKIVLHLMCFSKLWAQRGRSSLSYIIC